MTLRLAYLDVLRGVAVLVMVLAHVIDAWTRGADKATSAYYTALFIGGLGAPMFLFLAGVAQAMSAGSKARRFGDRRVGARAIWRRGWDVFLLALLFRLQSQVLGWGAFRSLLRVDILNVMGLAMVGTATLWAAFADRRIRMAAFAAATIVISFSTPLVRDAAWLAVLPDPLEAYIRPAGDYAAFTLFPWAAFLTAGALVGELIDKSAAPSAASLRSASSVSSATEPSVASGPSAAEPSVASGPSAAEPSVASAPSAADPSLGSVASASSAAGPSAASVAGVLAICGLVVLFAAWWASYRPSIYAHAEFWTSSPAFFFIKLGLVTLTVPATWAHCRFWLEARPAWVPGLAARAGAAVTRAVEVTGRSSLFVYWIHVEMVYGLVAGPLKGTLPIGGSLAATLVMAVLLYLIVLAKNRLMTGVVLPPRLALVGAVLR